MIDDPLNITKCRRGVDCNNNLAPEDVVLIRECADARKKLRRDYSELTNNKLAEKFDVHVRTIEKVVSGETWSHIL